jgi:hypothetical protein
MNHFLASVLAAMNAILALAIIVGGAIFGATYGQNAVLGLIIGLGGGIVAAVLVCGLLALLLDIRAELRELVVLARRSQVPPPQA